MRGDEKKKQAQADAADDVVDAAVEHAVLIERVESGKSREELRQSFRVLVVAMRREREARR